MTTADVTTAAPSHRWLRVFLVLIASLEFLDTLSGVQNIFTDYHHDTAMLRFAQALTSVKLAVSPLLAGATLVFAALGNIRRAILALAALTLTEWTLDSLPAIAIHGFEFSFDFGGLEAFVAYLVAPAVTVAAVLLALKDKRLALASLLVCLPALLKWLGFVVFFTTIMIYGF